MYHAPAVLFNTQEAFIFGAPQKAREVHSSLTDYVTLTRIQFAANLLRYHHYTIAQAAQEVGIPDVPYFTRLFKRTMGETPSQYARKKTIEAQKTNPLIRRILQRRSSSFLAILCSMVL